MNEMKSKIANSPQISLQFLDDNLRGIFLFHKLIKSIQLIKRNTKIYFTFIKYQDCNDDKF